MYRNTGYGMSCMHQADFAAVNAYDDKNEVRVSVRVCACVRVFVCVCVCVSACVSAYQCVGLCVGGRWGLRMNIGVSN